MTDEFGCPHCGELLPANAKFCRHCGASDDFGWNDDALGAEGYEDEGYNDEFDYDEYLRREFPEDHQPTAEQTRKRSFLTMIMILTCVGILLSAVLAAMSGMF